MRFSELGRSGVLGIDTSDKSVRLKVLANKALS